jgi:hypothetical protein
MKENKMPGIRGINGYYKLEKEKPVIQTDPMGSYTGRSNDPYEKPVQDADDL